MAVFRSAKRPLSIFLYSKLGAATKHTHGYSTWGSRAPVSQPTQIKDLFSFNNTNARTAFAVISRQFSDQAPAATEQMNLIKQLRERTSAPIKDVKAALVDSNWDIEAAQKELRKRGKVLASKKSSRTATEGLLALAQSEGKAAVIELNCETDFVARNEIFQYLALSLAKQALLVENISQQASVVSPVGPEDLVNLQLNLKHPKISGETTVQNAITEVAAIMGENVKLRRGFLISASSPGVVSTYLHTSPQPGLGRIGGILSLEVEDKISQMDALQRVGSELAMHVVASRPLFLTKELVSSDALANEREILKSQAESTGKSQMAIEKMVEGRLRKYYEDVVLMEQKFIMNDALNVKTILDNLSKEVGSPVKIGSFLRMEVGEGIQRPEESRQNPNRLHQREEKMAKSMRSKKLKRLRAIRREIVQPIYEKKEEAKLAAQEAALAAPKLPVRASKNNETSSNSMEIATTTVVSETNAMDVEMADGSNKNGSLKPVGGVGKKSLKKLKIQKKKRRGKGWKKSNF